MPQRTRCANFEAPSRGVQAARKRDDIENPSASKISADHRVQTEVSSKPTSARRSGSPSPPFRQLRTLREHPLRS